MTGATGVMGGAALDALLAEDMRQEELRIAVLARPSKRNARLLAPRQKRGVEVIWGDLLDKEAIARGVADADIVLHIGGMVSPAADWHPEQTLKVNVGAMANIIEAAKAREEAGASVKVVYIGSVSQYGNRAQPFHWGRVGDPIRIATWDRYALSKNLAEMLLAESGLKEWVSLRQTGIMHSGLLSNASDPIAFHVPMRGCLEWVSAEDSGRLMARICRRELPASCWRNFYNIGGGESWRRMNYDFVKATLSAVGCPKPEKVFDYNWFATGNFHGMWYEDSDDLDALTGFRSGVTFKEYFAMLRQRLPFYFRLAPLAPAALIKLGMKRVALKQGLGPLRWVRDNNADRIRIAWGSREAYDSLPDWKDADLREPSKMALTLMHGYDESKTIAELTAEELQEAARFRGGRLLTADYATGDIYRPLEWECADGHCFRLSAWSVLRGGHWCESCLRAQSDDPDALRNQAARNPYLSQGLAY